VQAVDGALSAAATGRRYGSGAQAPAASFRSQAPARAR
jgi:hypothetical protein